MKFKLLFTLLLVYFTQKFYGQSNIDCSSLYQGAILIKKPKSYVEIDKQHSDVKNYSAEAILDRRSNSVWRSQSNQTTQIEFIIELSGSHLIHNIVFNNIEVSTPNRSVKNAQISFSNIDTNTFTNVMSVELKKSDTTNIVFNTQKKARWIKIKLNSNYGDPTHIELSDIMVYGNYSGSWPSPNAIQGYWDSNWGWLCIKKLSNGSFGGHYEFKNGKITQGTLTKGRKFDFEWDETKEGGSTGWAKMILNEEGSKLVGVWGAHNSNNNGIWSLTKNNDKTNNCPIEDLEETPIIENNDKPYINMNITVLDDSGSKGKPVPSCLLKFIPKSEGINQGVGISDSKGKYSIKLPKSSFTIEASKAGFLPNEQDFVLNQNQSEIDITIIVKKPKVGDVIQLENIQFERGKFNLLPSSYSELDKLVKLMIDNPNMKIELSGHTDNFGSAKLNQKLSEKRVDSVKKYVTNKGISKHRVAGTGYGGTKPLTSNSTEEGRKLNRRVEFKVLQY